MIGSRVGKDNISLWDRNLSSLYLSFFISRNCFRKFTIIDLLELTELDSLNSLWVSYFKLMFQNLLLFLFKTTIKIYLIIRTNYSVQNVLFLMLTERSYSASQKYFTRNKSYERFFLPCISRFIFLVRSHKIILKSVFSIVIIHLSKAAFFSFKKRKRTSQQGQYPSSLPCLDPFILFNTINNLGLNYLFHLCTNLLLTFQFLG